MPENKDNNVEANSAGSETQGEKLIETPLSEPAVDPKAAASAEKAATVDAKAVASAEKAAKPSKAEKAAKPSKAEKFEKAAKAAKDEKSEKPTKAEKAQKAATPRGRATRKATRRWPAIVAGVVTAAVAVAVVGAGSLFPGVDATAVTTPSPHVLPVGESMANCQGPTQLLAGSAAGADPEFSPSSSGTKTSVNAVVLSSAEGDIPGSQIQGLDGKFSPLAVLAKPSATSASAQASASAPVLSGEPKARAEVLIGKTVAGPSVLRLDPLGPESSQGSGSVIVEATDGDLAGLAAATCQQPSNEVWLTGASTMVGRTAILALANSSLSPATVSLELFGSDGPVQSAGSKGLVVAPGTVRSVVLSGLAPDSDALSVHVKSVGGPVSAVIQQSVLRGLTPGGIDYLAPVQAPASSLAIAGVQVRSVAESAKITAQNDYADADTALMVTVPGIKDAVLEVKAFGKDGQVALPNGGVLSAAAGKVSTLSLAGLPEGSYSLAITADTAVTAAVRLSSFTKPGAAVDFAYAPSSPRLGETHLMTLQNDVDTSLVFAAFEGSATINLVPISASGVLGQGKDVEVRAGTSVAVNAKKLLGSESVAVIASVSGAPAFGSQVLVKDGGAGIAVLPLAQSSAGTQAINISTRY
ncbi:hypothetical protein ABIB48_001653 [Arthrobacter sp. UYCu511]|uniref:DUF5719 family protein n=1 Tax=Arthrobacter sp. UYCu511 TaxID=3156337 RepID=UPI0033990AAA